MKSLNKSLQQTFNTCHFSTNSIVYYHQHHHRILPRLTLSCKYGLAHESITAGFVTCYVHQRLVKRKFLLNQFICSSPSSKFYLSLTWRSGRKYKIFTQTLETSTEYTKCLKLFMKIKLYLACL